MSSFSLGSTAPDIHFVTITGTSLSLAPYFRSKRIVLLFVPSACAKEAEGYLDHFSKLQNDLKSRNLLILVFVPDDSSILKRDFGDSIILATHADHVPPSASPNSEAAPLFVLIGKDQTIKLREPQFVPDKALFATIDAMPMRKDEVQTAQVEKRPTNQLTQIEETITGLLQNAATFPVRYQPPAELLNSTSGRTTLSIARAKFEKDWDVKVISAKLTEEATRSVFWIINPKKALEPVKVRKPSIFDDDFDLDDLMAPLKF
jgi:hypothetical protein